VTAALAAMSLCALAVALLSPFPRAIAGPDGNVAAVLAAMAAAVAAELSRNGATGDTILVTVLCSLTLATAITGAALFALGELRAARWVRFIPYPVMGGYIAAVGWLLVVGAIRVDTGISVNLGHLWALLQPSALVPILVAVAFAVAILVATARVPHAVGLAVVLIAAVVLADSTFAFLPGGLQGAAARGWFLDYSGQRSWMPWFFDGPAGAISWTAIAQSGAEIVTVVLISTLTILINATAYEIDARTDVDLDRELRADGIANLASAAAGGFAGYFSLTRTLLNTRLGANGRASGIAVAVIGAAILASGARIIEIVPKFVLAGLLLYLGITMLDRWVVKTRPRLPPLEYAALLLIVIVNVWLGFLPGLIVGLVVGTSLFAFNYSRVAVISQTRTGAEFRSGLMRSAEEESVLAEHGREIRVFVLQGFLFFGMADRLYRTIRAHAIDDGARFVILDFARIVGIDSAAASSFVKIARAADRAGVQIVFTSMDERVAHQWIAASEGTDHDIEHFGDLDYAMEWCENHLIERYDGRSAADVTLRAWLAAELGSDALANALASYLQPLELARGETLCREGEAADSMFFVESGRIGIVMAHADGTAARLRSLGARSILGEMGLYRNALRSASAIAERASVVYVLTRESLQTLERADPGLAIAFHGAIVRELSERLAHQNVQIAALTE
jgi:sulfate permease, SulP family